MSKKARLGRGLSTLMSPGAPAQAPVPAPVPASPVKVDAPRSPDGVADQVAAPEVGRAESGGGAQAAATETAAAGSTAAADAARLGEPSSGGRWIEIEIGRVRANPYQPRRVFDEGALADLAASLKVSGVIQPVLVRPIRGGADGGGGEGGGRSGGDADWELIAGERRWRAAALAGLDRIPAIVREVDDRSAAEWAIVENVQRAELNPIERGASFRGLMERFGLTQQQVADRVGVDRSSVANLSRLLDLEPVLQGLVASERLSAGHGKALLSAPPGAGRVGLGERAATESWSVRQLEREAKKAINEGAEAGAGASQVELPPEAAARSTIIADMERRRGEQLGTKVRLKTDGKGERGRIEIEFYGLDHFDGLLRALGVSAE